MKRNLALNDFNCYQIHDLEVLQKCCDDRNLPLPVDFKALTSIINYDSNGACYRYYTDKNTGKPFFNSDVKIELSEFLKKYNGIVTSDNFRIDQICESFDYDKPCKKWDLTFHMGESRGLGLIRTQYDGVIENIVEGVLNEEYDVNKVYLPLLFLVRHSLEIALKHNILEASRLLDGISVKQIENEHSLVKLYNRFGGCSGYLNKLDLGKVNPNVRALLHYDKSKFELLKSTMHELDNNSFFFRFPVDRNGNNHSIPLRSKSIIEVLKLYSLTDSFITFINAVLMEEGLLTDYE